MVIHLGALKPGHRYLVQIFEPFWNNNWATAYSDGRNQSEPLNLSGPAVNGAEASQTPQSVTGTFTASSDSQDITIASRTDYLVFAALQLRDLGPVGSRELSLRPRNF